MLLRRKMYLSRKVDAMFESDKHLSPHQMKNAESEVTLTPSNLIMVHPEKGLEFNEETESNHPFDPPPIAVPVVTS